LKGLLQKAETVLKKQTPVAVTSGKSIISNDEQQEIVKEIDRITGHNRINVTPELFKITALKNGILFPILFNLAAVVILAGGIFATKIYFEIKDKEKFLASVEQQSAEGNLIKEIKKETEQKLAEKENEIQGIQANMQKIESERLSLEQNMNSKISERQTQLEAEMEAALAAEREKLLAQGISTEKVDEQIAAMKLEQSSIFDRELQNFREEAELQKIELESNLNQLQNEYNNKLVSVNEERARIETEAQNREAALTAQLEARTKELESEKTEAQLEIQRLTNERAQESLVENQIIGFYKSVEDQIKDGDMDNASVELKKLQNYLYDDSVINRTGISKRREIDLFVIDSLSKLIEASKIDPREEQDTMSLLDAAESLKEIQQIVKNADQQLAVGNMEMADIMYRNALEKIPEIKRSHNFFLDAIESELELGYEQLSDIQSRFDQLQKENSDRRAGVSSLIAAADRTYDSGNYRDAITTYKKAFEATGYENLDLAANKMLTSGNTLAVAPFKETVKKVTGDLNDLKDEQRTLESELDRFNQQLHGSEGNLTTLNEKLVTNQTELASLNDILESERTKVLSLNSDLEKQNNDISTYQQRIDEMQQELAKEREKVTSDQEDSKLIDREIAELTTLKSQLNRLNKSYTEFEMMAENLDDNIQGDAQTIESLYDFFEEDSVEDVMPGISEYLRSFSNVYINAGQEIGLYEAVSLLYDLNNLDNNSEKRQLLKDQKESYQDNEAMTEMINQIELSIGRGAENE
jgi:predicted  nucleic acid-binding Zn-ribbon protein